MNSQIYVNHNCISYEACKTSQNPDVRCQKNRSTPELSEPTDKTEYLWRRLSAWVSKRAENNLLVLVKCLLVWRSWAAGGGRPPTVDGRELFIKMRSTRECKRQKQEKFGYGESNPELPRSVWEAAMLAVTPYPTMIYVLPEHSSSSARKNEDSWTSGQHGCDNHSCGNKSILSVSLHNFQIVQPNHNHSNFPRKRIDRI